MSGDSMTDFLGAFAIVRRGEHCLFVGNERVVGGRPIVTWDLPGGGVERGELLHDAVLRELREETGLIGRGEPQLLFVQEGERTRGGRRLHAWRSFFFAVDVEVGEPIAGNEVVGVRWLGPEELRRELTAPYHDSFLTWLDRRGTFFRSVWAD